MGDNGAWLLLTLALALLVLPIWWVLAAFFAAIWHEGCHYLLLRICGGRAAAFHVGLTGAALEIRGLSPLQELFCAVAGPVGSMILLLFAKWLPRTAICAGFQGMYNLLPVYPLDGGRVVRCMTQLVLPPKVANLVCIWLERICLAGIVLLSLYGWTGLRLGFAPLIVGAGMIWRIKSPCKPWRNSVQWDKKLQ